MDVVPYDFVDRVFTKLDSFDIYFLSSQSSPLWMEASRVYKEQLRYLGIEIVFANDEASFHLQIDSSHRTLPDLTYEGLASSDSRFIRIAKLRISQGQPNLGGFQFPTEHLSAMFRSLSHFRIVKLETCAYFPSKDFAYEYLINQFEPERLYANDFPIADGFLQNQLQSLELRQLKLLSCGRSDFKSQIEAFVCRERFQSLECTFDCLDMDCVKRIVAYWRAMQNAWKSYGPFKIFAPTLKFTTKRDLTDEFAAWLTPTTNTGEFREENGLSTLVVNCDATSCNIQFT